MSGPVTLRTLDDAEVNGKTVLVRVDLNVPMVHGKVSDITRIRAIVPTLRELAEKGAKVVVLSHFDRPKGRFVPSMSLAPLVDVVEREVNIGTTNNLAVRFGVDVLGNAARRAVDETQYGEIVILENVRFHAGEEANEAEFAKALANLGDVFVNDAFSASHRAHASVVGVAEHLPSFAGRLLQREVEAFERLLQNPQRPLAAVVGGAKISTKLEILDNLLGKVDYLVIGGAMANTFLKAQGKEIGTSLFEPDLIETAKSILQHAKEQGCELVLPNDVVVADKLQASAESGIVSCDAIPPSQMQLDVGPETVFQLLGLLKKCKSLVWNGPLGAFETRPFDVATIQLARMVAARSRSGDLFSLAGGGDTVSALSHAGLADEFSYLSTAGGAFLEWLQGNRLPGIAVLERETLSA